MQSSLEPLFVGKHRLVHLDLKGAPPKLRYYNDFLALIKQIGATGILLEWEDTFPYQKELLPIGGLSESAKALGAPYSIAEAKQILSLAAEYELLVIPLVQTFGHLEFVLKHAKWRHLMEVEGLPSSMCPSRDGAMALVQEMVKQIVDFHPGIEYLHIGADEVWHLGLCSNCVMLMEKMKKGKEGLYLSHVVGVVNFIKENYPRLKIIMWDDMLRSIDSNVLNDYKIGQLVEPMVWNYAPNGQFILGPRIWKKYNEVFRSLWIASAFKGASSSCQIVPPNLHHVSNHSAWLNELGLHHAGLETNQNFHGIALTGWSRFDHYATLCELLPTAIPSLCLCLKMWLKGHYDDEIHKEVATLLGYNKTNVLFGCSLESQQLPQLSFPGWQVCVGFERFIVIRQRYRNLANSDQMQTWLNEWQVANNVTNPMQYASIKHEATELLNQTQDIGEYLETHLKDLYFEHTVDELMGSLVKPVLRHLTKIKQDCDAQFELGCRVRGQKLNLRE